MLGATKASTYNVITTHWSIISLMNMANGLETEKNIYTATLSPYQRPHGLDETLHVHVIAVPLPSGVPCPLPDGAPAGRRGWQVELAPDY